MKLNSLLDYIIMRKRISFLSLGMKHKITSYTVSMAKNVRKKDQ